MNLETNILAAILLPALAIGILFFTTMKKKAAWEGRGYADRKIPWNKLAFISSAVGYIMGLGSFLLSADPNVLVSTTLAIGGYLMVFASVTDFLLLRIPSETTTVSMIMGALLFLVSIPQLIPESYISLMAWGVFVVTMKICSYKRWLGDGDSYIIVASFFLYGWWMPPNDFALSLIIITVFGVITALVSKFTNLGVKKTISETSKWNPETGKMEATSLDINEVEKDTKKQAKAKNFFPFGPSILAGFALTACYSSIVSYLPPF